MYIHMHIYYGQMYMPLSWLLKNYTRKLRHYLCIIQNIYESRQITVAIIARKIF